MRKFFTGFAAALAFAFAAMLAQQPPTGLNVAVDAQSPTQQPSFVLSVQPLQLSLGSGTLYTPGGLVPVQGPFNITSNGTASDGGTFQIGIDATGNGACWYAATAGNTLTYADFTATGFSVPCQPGPDPSLSDLMYTVNVAAGNFQPSILTQYSPVTMPWACFGIVPTFPGGN
jgi:hypothetical protein